MDSSRTPAEEPDIVAVAGTGASTDAPVPMVEGATGAYIPTGEHRPSGAMPATDGSDVPDGSGRLVVLAASLIVVFAVAAWAISNVL